MCIRDRFGTPPDGLASIRCCGLFDEPAAKVPAAKDISNIRLEEEAVIQVLRVAFR